jgi:hypothetical protein
MAAAYIGKLISVTAAGQRLDQQVTVSFSNSLPAPSSVAVIRVIQTSMDDSSFCGTPAALNSSRCLPLRRAVFFLPGQPGGGFNLRGPLFGL